MAYLSYELDIAPNSIWNFITTTTNAKENFLYLQEAGHFFANSKYYTIRKGLDSFLVKLTVAGQGILEYADQIEVIGPGHFYLIDCIKPQKYYTDPSIGHWDVIWIHFNGITARAYYDSFLKLGKGSVVGQLSDDSSMYALLGSLLNRTANSDYPFKTEQNLFEFDIHTSGILNQVLMECIFATGISRQIHHIPPIVRDIRSYLVANYNTKVTLNHLAAKFNLDPYYLQKLFKRSLGQSPAEYIIHLRMNRAKNLIRTSPMSISEIACDVGIDNISHFSRQFKEHEGMTPVQYRKKWHTEKK